MYYAKSKYKAKKEVVDGITFASSLEAERYRELRIMEEAGLIRELTLQPAFILQPAFKKDGKNYRKITYVADFSYFDITQNKAVVEDVKGFETDVYKLKKKLYEYRYDTPITEIRKKGNKK